MTQTPTPVCSTGFVVHTHHTGGDAHILCLQPCECGHPSILPVLFQEGALVTLTLSAPDPETDRGRAQAHPRLDVHLNPGSEQHHDPCLSFDTCGPCLTGVWEAIFRNGGGHIGIHAVPGEPDTVVIAPFRIGDWPGSRTAVKTVAARLLDA